MEEKRPCEQAGARRQQVQRRIPKRDPKGEEIKPQNKERGRLCKAGSRIRRGMSGQAQILMRVPLAKIRKKGKMRSWKEALKVWMWVMLSAL